VANYGMGGGLIRDGWLWVQIRDGCLIRDGWLITEWGAN
jgi:hypothetical protein